MKKSYSIIVQKCKNLIGYLDAMFKIEPHGVQVEVFSQIKFYLNKYIENEQNLNNVCYLKNLDSFIDFIFINENFILSNYEKRRDNLSAFHVFKLISLSKKIDRTNKCLEIINKIKIQYRDLKNLICNEYLNNDELKLNSLF